MAELAEEACVSVATTIPDMDSVPVPPLPVPAPVAVPPLPVPAPPLPVPAPSVSLVPSGSWSGFDPSVCGYTQPMMPGAIQAMWPPQSFAYPIPPPPPKPTVISAPPLLNANGLKRRTDKDMLTQIKDPSLPKELTQMFQPLYCVLCKMHLNSASNAKLHYLSKNHHKKIKKYLIEHSEKTGEPLHKRARTVVKAPVPVDPKYIYCSICDLQLTSKLHAEQHYMGRNHQRAANKTHKPAGLGYYDEQGKWHRTEKVLPVSDPTGRFGIGMAFVTQEEIEKAEVEAKTQAVATAAQSKFYCELCRVSTTSAEHLRMHISGQKHKKLLKRSATTIEVPEDNFQDLVPLPRDNILQSVVKNEPSKVDYSVYRTPSGWYYCQPCNVTINAEQLFVKHLESKKHMKKKFAQHGTQK